MPSLSLCLIAKNEAEFLADCLASVSGVCDQLVVVDTGSTDATAAIARAAGATVVDHAWTDDFSAARNAALAAATGDWVLVLDADERLHRPNALRAAIAKGGFDLGLIPLHNADALDAPVDQVLSGARRRGEPVLVPRLLRRTPDLRWQGCIHEQPHAWAVGRPMARLDAALVHLGNVPSVRVARDKRARNVRLLQARTAADPKDVQAWAWLAGEHLHDNDLGPARAALAAGWRALQCLPPGHAVPTVQLLTLRAHRQLADGQPGLALETLAAGRSDHPNLWLLEALALAQAAPDLADPVPSRERGVRLLNRCLAHQGTTLQEVLPGATGHVAATLLAELCCALGELDDAEAAVRRAQSLAPGHAQAALAHAEVLIHRGQPSAALVHVEPLLDAERPDAWVLAARACRDLGEPLDLIALARRGAQLRAKGFLAAHRRGLLEELLAEASLYSGAPGPGPGVAGALAALSARAPADETPRHPEHAGQIALNAVAAGQAQWMEPWFEPRADAMLPGLGEVVRAALATQGITLDDDGEPDFVFIGGAGRSGTTLFRTMLGAHHRIHCGPELKLVPTLLRQVDTWRRTMGADLTAAGVDEGVLGGASRAFIRALLQGTAPVGMRVAEKTPHNLLHTAELARLFPRARFIHVVRDGRAVTASLLRQRWLDPNTGEPLAWCRDVAHASAYWAEVVECVRAQAHAAPDRFLEVHYEALVQDPERTMRGVLAFLGERWDDQVLAHQDAGPDLSPLESSSAAVARAVHTDAVDAWREHLGAADLAQLDPKAQAWLVRLGYSSDGAGLRV